MELHSFTKEMQPLVEEEKLGEIDEVSRVVKLLIFILAKLIAEPDFRVEFLLEIPECKFDDE